LGAYLPPLGTLPALKTSVQIGVAAVIEQCERYQS